ncbi:hypothetical protein BH24ACT20_BH24ACT20_16530 [soil metagenome]
MIFPWSKSPEERMISEVRSEVEGYLKRCEALHEEFRQRLRVRDDARAALSEAEENIKSLQVEGVSLLSDFSAAMSAADEDGLREAERGYKRHSRGLGKAEKHRDRMAGRLESVEVDEEEVSRELRDTVSEALDEYAQSVAERKQWLAGVMEVLDDQREELGRAAAPLMEEYESRRSPEELPPAPSEEQPE